MSKELEQKQIEELTAELVKSNSYGTCNAVANHLYNVGYHKQSEGEWYKIKDFPRHHFCNQCGKGNRTKANFCPNCGAKMKAEEKKEAQKYFSPEDVRKMSSSEVKANYQAILDSMKKWE